jgi:hypothetical protein
MLRLMLSCAGVSGPVRSAGHAKVTKGPAQALRPLVTERHA